MVGKATNNGEARKSYRKVRVITIMGRRYITCDNCGRKIVEGKRVVYTPGIVYNCCSASCLAQLMLDVRAMTLDDAYVEAGGIEWEGELLEESGED